MTTEVSVVSARHVALVTAVAALCSGFWIQSSSFAQPSAQRVVFSWERDGNIDIYIAGTDGSGLRRLTNDPAPDEFPRCSADGRHLVFRRGGANAGDVFRLDLETQQEHRLTNDAVRDSTPHWSRDGKTIYATKRLDGYDRIVSYDTDGRQLRVVGSTGDWHEVMPVPSPDGRFLVHHTYQHSNEADLQLLDLTNMQSKRLTAAAGNDYEPSFVDDRAVVFSSNRQSRQGGHYRIYLLSLAAPDDVKLLADTGADAWGARYSSSSRSVLFYTGKPGAWRLMTVDLAGGAPQPLLDDGTSKSGPDWCLPAR